MAKQTLIGEKMAIHASKTAEFSKEFLQFMKNLQTQEIPDEMLKDAVTLSVTANEFFHETAETFESFERAELLGTST